MYVASCRSIFILSDVVYNRAFVSFRFSVRDGSAWPMVRPTPAQPRRAPGALPPCAPSLSFLFSQQLPSPSLPPLSTSPCPRWDSSERLPPLVEPRVELPISSPLLSLLPTSPARPLAAPSPARAWPCPPTAAPDAAPVRRGSCTTPPRRGPQRGPGARSPNPVRAALTRVAFKFSSNSVLNSV
jgi:hypothetical protein